jgi:anti-sigma-K factor RskA
MSGAEDDDPDLLAAEYVLGCLDSAEMRRVEAMAIADPAMQRAINDWTTRLSPMAGLVAPVDPPADLWPRLDASISGGNVVPLRPKSRPSLWSNPRLWRITTAASLAIAAGFAGVAFFVPPRPVYVAALAPLSGPAPAFVVRSDPDGSLVVSAVAPAAVPPDKSLELWGLLPGAQRPVSLGVLPPGGRRVPPSGFTQPRTQILVSLEPSGGSPTGQPTGPVLYGGTLD